MISTKTNKAATKRGVRIKSRVKAGGGKGSCPDEVCMGNHNQTAKGLRIKSQVKAGAKPNPDPEPK